MVNATGLYLFGTMPILKEVKAKGLEAVRYPGTFIPTLSNQVKASKN